MYCWEFANFTECVMFVSSMFIASARERAGSGSGYGKAAMVAGSVSV